MTSRFTSTSMQALSEQDVVAFRLLADVAVQSTTLYFCTGNNFILPSSLTANTYTPVGAFGEVTPFEEESDSFPRDVTVKLSAFSRTGSYAIGLDPAEPVQENIFGRPITFKRAYLDIPTGTLTVAPEQVWKGTAEEIDLDINGMAFAIRYVSAYRSTAPVSFFNKETMQTFIDSSDTFADHVDQIPLTRGNWGGQDLRFLGSRRFGNALEEFARRVRVRGGG